MAERVRGKGRVLPVDDPVAEEVYAELARSPWLEIAELAALTSLTEQETDEALGRLVDMGAAEHAAGVPLKVVVLPPSAVAAEWVRRLEDQVIQSHQAVESLTQEYLAARGAGSASRIRAVSAEEMLHLFETGQENCRSSVRGIAAPPFAAVIGTNDERQLRRMSQGISYRTVYAAEALNNPAARTSMLHMLAHGEEGRFIARTPMKLVVFDEDLALVPVVSRTRTAESLVIGRSDLLDGFLSLFETVWEMAMPLGVEGTVDTDLGDDERELLYLMAAGSTDLRIARHFGVSSRTVERRIKTVLERLGATSRFQAGALAARRGWL
ncbi:helix-turn-helix transcriptional regulator [Streptomyces sp. PKU-EA00015]|uniref:helix-turn-helix transcriptional regulator n=1 Tax=Streptomyces sp. PKU-EA00015 TaxID=2748326 RepID=UPI00159FC51C|nr:helix-turn-helix transcriptional regulator [Streptomyces sp. PKU-EA00015]NWF25099.1 helix-turn-helix transcriptional regulator [Streptomyces sp. PKU-EA00015]